LPMCELCGEYEPTIFKCKICGTLFCEYCGDAEEEVCINCLEEYTVEEVEQMDSTKDQDPQNVYTVQQPKRLK